MCGRYTLAVTGAPLGEMLRLSLPPADFAPRFNIAPSQPCPTIVGGRSGAARWSEHRWGLSGRSGIHINARSETVAELPRFRELFPNPKARCLVPADGYYEWRKEGSIRQPYHFSLPERGAFCFAGLAENGDAERSADGAERTHLILTMDANESTRNIHHRMPVVLLPDQYERWLFGDAREASEALAAAESPTYEQRAVSQRVNDVRHDDPYCLEGGRTQPLLFDL